MDMKTFEYLFYKVRGASKGEIINHAKLTEAEYDFMEGSFVEQIEEIKKDRAKAEDIGPEFVRLTRYLYGKTSAQQEGVPRPNAIKTIPGESIALPAVGTLEKPKISLYDAINNRRSLRQYSDEPLSMEELSFLLRLIEKQLYLRKQIRRVLYLIDEHRRRVVFEKRAALR